MPQGVNPEKKEKDFWDKLDIVFKAIASCLVATVSLSGSIYLFDKQRSEAKTQLYTQLISARETADSNLRKAMFDTIIKDLLKPEPKQIEDRILALEILTYNFHDVIALGPLFKQLEVDITSVDKLKPAPDQQQKLLSRLRDMSSEVSYKQLAALRKDGVVKNQDVYFDDLKNNPAGITVMDEELRLSSQEGGNKHARRFVIRILDKHEETQQLLVHLSVSGSDNPRDLEIHNTFWVGFSDFPMIDNTRLNDGNRVAIVLRRWESQSAELWFAYFSGTRASLKDKMYYEEVIKEYLSASL